MSTTPRNDWDPPADGDFASYVERLSVAQVVPPAPVQREGARQKRTAAAASAASAASAAPAPSSRPVPSSRQVAAPGASPSGVTGLVRGVRAVVLLLVIGQALALFYFKTGFLSLLLFTGVLWLALGRLQRILSRVLSGANGTDSASLQRLREQLQRSVRERANTPKK